MIFDIHTHTFPDALAPRAIGKLEAAIHSEAFTDGTLAANTSYLHERGIDEFLVLHIATNVHQEHSVNDFAITLQQQGIHSFGSVHPDSPDIERELKRLKAAGIRGVKLHPMYQNFEVDDPRVLPIYELCESLDLTILFHAGRDAAYPDSDYAQPPAFRRVIERFPRNRFVLAHMGGWMLWDAVEEYLCGTDVWIDTALFHMIDDPAQAMRIFGGFDREKVLFGSDCPWADPNSGLDCLRALPLSADQLDDILYNNAIKLLKV